MHFKETRRDEWTVLNIGEFHRHDVKVYEVKWQFRENKNVWDNIQERASFMSTFLYIAFKQVNTFRFLLAIDLFNSKWDVCKLYYNPHWALWENFQELNWSFRDKQGYCWGHARNLSGGNNHLTTLSPKTLLQDIPPILVSVMGGFLQQMYGPKRILMVSAVPSILSWFLVALGSSSISILLMSRFIQHSNYSVKWTHKQFVSGSARAWPLDFWLEMFSWCTQLQTATSGHSRWSRWKEKKR